jgi:hypothetical protein|tara:strand:- start:584 stop:802 length:219 start_codon:yes stop_codon:yes gene_type:complete
MFENISFENEDDKWLWGTILGGISLTIFTSGVLLGCYCRNCCKKKVKIKENSEFTKKEANNIVVSAPLYSNI